MIDSIVLLIAFVIIYAFIIEIFTVLFRLTGLTEDVARFQVISLLTACGFTTSQSETITYSKRRRKLAYITILFGYTFSLIIVSVAVNAFLAMSVSEVNTFVAIGITLSIIFLIVFILIKSRRARLRFDNFINRTYEKISRRKSNNVILMDLIGDSIIATVHLTYLPDLLNQINLRDSGLQREHGIKILVHSRNEERLDIIDGNTVLEPGDTIVLFGPEKEVFSLFEFSTPESSQ